MGQASLAAQTNFSFILIWYGKPVIHKRKKSGPAWRGLYCNTDKRPARKMVWSRDRGL